MHAAVLGDIIGSPCGSDRGSTTRDFPLFSGRSAFTDDTVMTLAVADAFPSRGDPGGLKEECRPPDLPEVLQRFDARLQML